MSKRAEGVEVAQTETVENIEKDVPKVEEKKEEKQETPKVVSEKKISVSRFLQDYPQKSYVTTLLRKTYPMIFKTVSQWNQNVTEIKNKKIKG